MNIIVIFTGDDNRPDFPGLTRGLVAVLLYYDGRRSLVNALRTLLLALSGRTWTLGLSPDLTYLTNTYIQKLVEENLTNKILGKFMNKFINIGLQFIEFIRILRLIKYKYTVNIKVHVHSYIYFCVA